MDKQRFVALINDDLYNLLGELSKAQTDYSGERAFAKFKREIVRLGAVEYAKKIEKGRENE